MPRIGIILGSTRPNRNGEQVARWVFDNASQRADAEFELIDLRDYPLPHLDEPMPPSLGQYADDHTKEWAQKIASFDGFVIVTPEYNHGTSGVLKNAIDFLYRPPPGSGRASPRISMKEGPTVKVAIASLMAGAIAGPVEQGSSFYRLLVED
jgi:NAD(P)H-dependent FMN reductase